MFLKIASVPSDGHTESNAVYMNPADLAGPAGGAKFIDVRGFPYSILPDDRVAPGTLAMNGIQRKCCGVTTTIGDGVELLPGGLRPPPAVIASTVLELEHVAASKRGGSVDVKDFVEFFLKRFEGQYFRDGQSLAVIQENSPYKFLAKFTNTINASASGKNEDVLWGAISPDTKLVVRATEKSEIALTNIPDAQLDDVGAPLMQKFDLENLGIGGLRAEFGQVFRRAFASRIFPQSFVKKLNIKHAKGVLLYGPPGTGKTLIARKIGEILNCRAPKIVNGPEVFNKFVGGTEENVRKLFAEAEAEQASKGDQSQLHLIIFDEFDAICKQRGATRDGTGVNDNVVNQLLSKIDGVNSLNNVLLIGMTNRKDLIDEAILRPGRFEVHVEIGLPNEEGRVEIFRIHTKGMRENDVMAADVHLEEMAKLTKNYSGAEIEGVVRSATSNAFNRHVDFEHPTETIQASDVHVTREDFLAAIEEITPAFGQAKDACENVTRGGIIPYGPLWDVIDRKCNTFVEHLRGGNSRIESLAVLVEGPVGCGKSAVAAHLAMRSDFPYVKFISNDNLVGYGEVQKSNIIRKAFDDAYKSNLSVIVLDDLERLIEYSHLGGRYSNVLLQTLLVLIKRPPPEGKKLMVVGTTSLYDVMESLELTGCFSVNLQIPTLDVDALPLIVKGSGARFRTTADERLCMDAMPSHLGIKKLLLVIEMASEGEDAKNRTITFDSFNDAIMSTGLR